MDKTFDIAIHPTNASRLPEIDFNNLSFGEIFSDHVFSADYMDGSWKNLQIKKFENISLSPATAVLHYAQTIFEGLKAHRADNGDILIFRATENAKRFNQSAARMCMPQVPESLFLQAIHMLIKLDKEWVPTHQGSALYIRPFQFATDAVMRVKPSQTYKFMILTGPVGGYYAKPLKLKIETEFTRAASGGVGASKTGGSYAGSLYPELKAQEKGYHQLIWTDGNHHKYIEEAGTMNIMFVMDGKLITPELNDTVLDGITRRSALTLAKEWGVITEERPVTVQEIMNALAANTLTEVFGIGTAATISHISTIGYKGKDYTLPPVEKRTISNRLLEILTDIKCGKVKDSYGWIHRIE